MNIYQRLFVLYAKWFAKKAHAGQKDDSGKDYFTAHVQQVADLVSRITKDYEIIAAAYLHDTIEDTDTTYTKLHDEFGVRVADIVLELTKDKKTGRFPHLKSKDAILVKFADRLSNLSRMEAWDADRQQAYVNKSKFWLS